MIPDKIYIQTQDGKTITTNRVFATDVEFIRKEGLLKWARSMIASDKTRGIKGGFYMLIDKLNEM